MGEVANIVQVLTLPTGCFTQICSYSPTILCTVNVYSELNVIQMHFFVDRFFFKQEGMITIF